MKAKEYSILSQAVEDGVAYGWGRAFKHGTDPTDAYAIETITNAVLSEICEWFDFEWNVETEITEI